MTTTLLLGLWQRGRWHLILLGTGLTVFATLFLSFVRPDDAARRTELGYGMLAIVIICLGIDLMHLAEGKAGHGFDTRLFILPVSSLRLASTWIAALAGILVAVYALGGIALALWFDVPRPKPEIGILVATLVASVLCVLWSTPQKAAAQDVRPPKPVRRADSDGAIFLSDFGFYGPRSDARRRLRTDG